MPDIELIRALEDSSDRETTTFAKLVAVFTAIKKDPAIPTERKTQLLNQIEDVASNITGILAPISSLVYGDNDE